MLDKLTTSERAFVDLLVATAGARNKILAHQLGITEGTVKAHLHAVYAKLGIANRTALVVQASAVGRGQSPIFDFRQ
jgi:two-component system nitrate/nitrite response regulator NarP